jgi:hypothetical protein
VPAPGSRRQAENDVPVIFWQDLQWQTPAKIGSASALYRTLPQEQPPSIFAMFFLPLFDGTSLADFRPAWPSHFPIAGHTIFASNGGSKSGASNSRTQRSGSNFTWRAT